MSEKRKLRAVGYSRTSGEGQRDNTSIPIQKGAIEGFIYHNEWDFVGHYVDESKTGSTIAGRDDFQRLLKDAALGMFDLIVPFDVSRFARDGVDILETTKFLRTNFDVHVVDTKGGFDSRPGSNILLNFVHAGVSEYERHKIMQRMIGGRIHKAQQGLPWSGKKPFGRDFNEKTGKWSVNERGDRMRQLLERYANGEGFSQLLKEFPEFTNSRVVLNFIRTSQLSGTYVKEFNIPDLNIHGLKIPIPAIPEIISPKLFARVEARLKHRRTWNQEHRRRYALTGFVRCGHCGTALTGNCTGGRIYYRHCNYSNTTTCAFHSIRKDELVEPVLDYLFSFFTDEPTFLASVARALPKTDERESVQKEHEQVRASITKIEKQIARLVNAIADGADATLLISKQTELRNECKRNAERLSAIEARLAAMPDATLLQHQATAIRLQLLSKVRECDWRQRSHDEIRRFLIFLFGENPGMADNGITVRREKGRWRITFRGKMEFHHELSDGRPLSYAVKEAASRHNEAAKRWIEQFVTLARQTSSTCDRNF
jgi:DNA invertase Pin-like site-specific DNA recombinase